MNLRSLVVLSMLVSAVASTIATPYSFLVKVVGHGKPMVLIPGLGCGGDVWESTVAHFASKYECHVMTLPGFAGQPPIPSPMLPRVRDEIISYIAANHLDHPVIVGHSLGASLALWIASKSPQTVGKVVAVDGAPWLPALMDPSAKLAEVARQAIYIRDGMAKMDKTAFTKATRQSLESMITKPRDVEEVLMTSSRSDPRSVGEAMYELYTNDLRPQMAKIRVPVLMLAEGAFFTTADIRKAAMANYESQIHSIPNHTLRMSLKSRHFLMLDDPEFFFRELDKFL